MRPAFLYKKSAGRANSAATPPSGLLRAMSESASIEHPSGLTGGDLIEADEPLRLFAAWFEQAARSEPRAALRAARTTAPPPAPPLGCVPAPGVGVGLAHCPHGADERLRRGRV